MLISKGRSTKQQKAWLVRQIAFDMSYRSKRSCTETSVWNRVVFQFAVLAQAMEKAANLSTCEVCKGRTFIVSRQQLCFKFSWVSLVLQLWPIEQVNSSRSVQLRSKTLAPEIPAPTCCLKLMLKALCQPTRDETASFFLTQQCWTMNLRQHSVQARSSSGYLSG